MSASYGALLEFPAVNCGLAELLKHPLYNPYENYIHPCFLSAILLLLHVVMGLLAAYQTFDLLFRNHFGTFPIKYSFGSPWRVRSVGALHFIRLNSVLVQSLLYIILMVLNMLSSNHALLVCLFTLFLMCCMFMFPLHFIETTRSIVGHSSLIAYWFFSAIIWLVIVALDHFSPHKVFSGFRDKSTFSLAYTVEVLLFLNSVGLHILETYLYSPSVELKEYFDLNDWDASSIYNLPAAISFQWVEPILHHVYKNGTIEVPQLPNTSIELQSEYTIAQFRDSWQYELKRAVWWGDRRIRKKAAVTEEDRKINPSLFLALLRVHKVIFFKAFCAEVADITFTTLSPFLLQRFIIFIDESTAASGHIEKRPPVISGIFIAVSLYLCSVARYICFNQAAQVFFKCSFSIKSALTCLIYEKALKLSAEGKKEKSTGDIVNHVSVDVGDISLSIENCSDVLTVILRLAITLAALYKLLGNAMWAGLATALILVPLSTLISTALYSLYNKQMELKDERTRFTSEILNAIKSIKLYSWETPMLNRLDEVRNKKELVMAQRMGIYNAGSSFLWESIPFVISCAVYSFYAMISKKTLVPSVIFPALSLFDLLAAPIAMLPAIFSSLVEAKVALERMSKFFVLEDIDEDMVQRTNKALRLNDTSVSISNATMVWSSKNPGSNDNGLEELNVALKDINFAAKKGQLTCIVGRVGAGKSTLLKSLIGEVPLKDKAKSSIKVNGKIAYCSQSPCVLNCSIRENILFGKKYDKTFYEKTVDACQLTSDFEVLPHGDATLVGEKGISLSGGQKARVSLARALYSKSDIYLLDDILSAVDAHVGKKITKHVLSPSGLLSSKTLILATNSMKVLPLAHEIVGLEGKTIVERGNYSELIDHKGRIFDLMKEFTKDKDSESLQSEDDLEEKSSIESFDENKVHVFEPHSHITMGDVEDLGELNLARTATHNTIGAQSVTSFGHDYVFEDEYHELQKVNENKEKQEQGHVKLSVYIEFIKACNWICMAIWLLFFLAVVAMNIFGSWVLKSWSEKNLQVGYNLHPAVYLLFYAFTGIAGGFLTFASAYIIWTFSAVRSSTYFHDKMAMSVLRSPMSFFDTTPIGRILNRFSDDISVLDQQVLWHLTQFASLVIECAMRLFIVIYNLPFMFIVIACLVVLYNHFRNRFVPASRELKRLKSALRSPVFSHLQESINGTETIRAFGEQERFLYSNRAKVDAVTKIDWIIQGANRWLSMRLQSIAAIIVLSATLLILFSIHLDRCPSPAMVGFLMSYVFSSTSTLNAIIRYWAEVEAKAVSLERLIEYGNLPSEAPLIIQDNSPNEAWPSTGAIQFSDYSTRYRENLEPVLKHINLNIKPAEKVGIVGRTGAGKSSLTLALFRLIEPTSGHIDIDQVNTSTLGLFDLRSQLNIIPQDAHVFEGTIRQNLDPFDQYTDDRLWEVLDMAHLKTHVEGMKTEAGANSKNGSFEESVKPQVGLRAKVHEGGSNLSSGQKQLMCLARALLKESKVLVLDEATAAVDVQTDRVIQETIRTQFKDRTILTIAHRLDTIMDSDRVLVLARGEVKEFDTPEALLRNPQSEFYSLCKEGGYLDNKSGDK